MGATSIAFWTWTGRVVAVVAAGLTLLGVRTLAGLEWPLAWLAAFAAYMLAVLVWRTALGLLDLRRAKSSATER